MTEALKKSVPVFRVHDWLLQQRALAMTNLQQNTVLSVLTSNFQKKEKTKKTQLIFHWLHR